MIPLRLISRTARLWAPALGGAAGWQPAHHATAARFPRIKSPPPAEGPAASGRPFTEASPPPPPPRAARRAAGALSPFSFLRAVRALDRARRALRGEGDASRPLGHPQECPIPRCSSAAARPCRDRPQVNIHPAHSHWRLHPVSAAPWYVNFDLLEPNPLGIRRTQAPLLKTAQMHHKGVIPCSSQVQLGASSYACRQADCNRACTHSIHILDKYFVYTLCLLQLFQVPCST